MTKSYLLGIDIGTSACKVAVFDREGKVLAAANGDYPVYYPQEGWAEQNPEEWWSAVCKATKETIQKAGIAPEEIAGVGIDGQSWSAIAIDKEGKVLTNTPIWMDTRAQSILYNSKNHLVQRKSAGSLCKYLQDPSVQQLHRIQADRRYHPGCIAGLRLSLFRHAQRLLGRRNV